MKRGEIFHFVKSLVVPTSGFDMSHGGDTTVDMGYLAPIDCVECLPGDFWKLSETSLVKFQALLAPIQHQIDVSYHFFFVPTRLIWKHYEEFFTGGPLGDLAPVMPYFNVGDMSNYFHGGGSDHTWPSQSLPNYLTKCLDLRDDLEISALPFIGYQFIWNELFRDQNLQDPVELPIDAEGDLSEFPNWTHLLDIRKRCWEKDYYTSALPFAQRGPEVLASLAGSAPVVGDFLLGKEDGAPVNSGYVFSDQYGAPGGKTNLADDQDNVIYSTHATGPDGTQYGLFADLHNVSAFSINDLRELERTQEFMEGMARSGGRYVEQLLTMWGVISPDARMQRPEMIGYIKSPVQVREVLQTSPNMEDGSSEVSGVGTQTGQATSVNASKRLYKYCHEHGYIYCIASVMPRTSYSNTLHKMWMRKDKFDFAWSQFGHLGEQEVLNYEVNANHNNPFGVFGYQSRYAEYKYLPDFYSGDFSDTLSFWHLGRILPDDVALNSDFVSCNPRNDIFAVPDEPGKVKISIWFDFKVWRKLPKFGTPHF